MRHGKVPAVAAVAALLVCGTVACALARTDAGDTPQTGPPELRVSRLALGTLVELVVRDPDATRARTAIEAGFAEIERLEELLSEWRDTSELSRLDAAPPGGWVALSPETADALRAALRIGAASGGAFDPTVLPLVRLWGFAGGPNRVPSDREIAATLSRVGLDQVEIDARAPRARRLHDGVELGLGGIGKGFIADRVLALLRAAGVPAAMVAASGDFAFVGGTTLRPWPLGLEDPDRPGEGMAELALLSGALSTSAATHRFFESGGRRFHHILDPRTGRPAEGVKSVTVVAEAATETDAFATAIFVMGAAGPAFVSAHPELRAVIVLEDGSRFVSPGLDVRWVAP